MASSITATATTIARPAALVHKPLVAIPSSSVIGLPAMAKKGRVTCSMNSNQSADETVTKTGMSTSLIAAVTALSSSPAAMALVDDRMSTEGTGLPFGLSNNLLGWILLGVFGLIWALYTVYTSTLDEDDESGLSL